MRSLHPKRSRLPGFLLSAALMLPFIITQLTPESPVSATLPQTTAQQQYTAPALYPVELPAFHRNSAVTDLSESEVIDTLPLSSQNSDAFSISIPKINLHKDIVPNVHPSNKQIYLPIMARSVAHGSGTAFPDQEQGNVYLFAHSKKYSGTGTPDGGWFTRIDELAVGDHISINYKGTTYEYVVAEQEIVSPEDIAVYTSISSYRDAPSLTLQTCYPRGDTTYRLIVKAKGE